MSPELLLLTSLIIAIQVAMPIGTYLLFNGRHDDKTRLWLLSMTIISASTILVSVRPLLPHFLSHEIPWMMHVAGFLLMIETIRRESIEHTSWWRYGLLWSAFALSVTMIYFLGDPLSIGLAVYSTVVSVLCLVLWVMFHRLRKLHPSKSLLLLQIGVLLYGIPSVLRVVAFLYLGTADSMNVYKFSIWTNLLVFAFVLAVLFIALGYWGFTLEKSERERQLAKAGEDFAVQESERFRQLVMERDQLLVMNSRFSAVSALSSFSAMLIHDISQPLQAMQLGLERIRARLDHNAPLDQIDQDLTRMAFASDRAEQLVSSLRQLMRSGESQVTAVAITPILATIEDILSSTTLKKQVVIRQVLNLPTNTQVKAEALMLQRILVNVVANSLNQFKVNPVPDSEVLITAELERKSVNNEEQGLAIRIVDNGGGFPADILERVGQPWSSQSSEGLGIALMLSKQLVGLWGGQFDLANRSDGVTGALVRIWLKLAGNNAQ